MCWACRFFAVPMSPKFGNLRESTVEDLGELMPSGRLAWHSSFPGAEHVTPEQAENIKQSAAYCRCVKFLLVAQCMHYSTVLYMAHTGSEPRSAAVCCLCRFMYALSEG